MPTGFSILYTTPQYLSPLTSRGLAHLYLEQKSKYAQTEFPKMIIDMNKLPARNAVNE